MSRHMDIGQYAVTALRRYFDLVPEDLGADRTQGTCA